MIGGLALRRAIAFAALAAAAGFAADLLATHPGQVTIEGLGYRREPPIGLLVLAVLLFAAAAALLYRLVRAILGTPRRIGRALSAKRRKRGYKALSQGMVAVAAGDAQEAARWRSEERRVGKECVSPFGSRWAPSP